MMYPRQPCEATGLSLAQSLGHTWTARFTVDARRCGPVHVSEDHCFAFGLSSSRQSFD